MQQPPCFLCFPPPVLKLCPWLLEENWLCRILGQCGYCTEIRGLRSKALKFSLWLNTCGFLVTVFAALALTDESYDLLSAASFSKAELQPTTTDPTLIAAFGNGGVQSAVTFPTISLHLGLQALAVDNPNASNSETSMTATMIPFDEFCTTPGMEQLMPMEDCNFCADANLYLLVGLFVALVAYLPTCATDILRMYTNYDVNCQKVSAGLWGMLCLAGYGLVYYYYNEVCAASFYSGQVQYAAGGTVVDSPGTGVIVVDFAWKVGTGQICLLVGFGLKAMQFVFNCCVSTPTITRDRKEQWDYERLSEKAAADAEAGRNAGDGDESDGDESDGDDSSSKSSE